jgi:phosphoenolpyruvate synthase/pyruvate phosphate dikinase
MSILRNKDADGTSYYFESDGKMTVKTTQDVNPILKKNKQLYTLNDGYSHSKDLKRVASIPSLVLTLWAKEYNGTNNWFAIPKEERQKILRLKLNSSDFRYFRTAPGRM